MNKKELINSVWVEKFRPKTMKDIILPISYKRFFNKIIKEQKLPNLILHSTSAGTGKSSLAKVICNEMEVDYLYINASRSGIDVLRTDIEKFAHTKSLFSQRNKVVILDEFCGTTPQLQLALKADIERFTFCRFIITANHVAKIVEPLRSRCQEFNFNMMEKSVIEDMKPKVLKRLKNVLKFEKVEFDEETVGKIVDKFYPDIRKMIQVVQQYSNMYQTIDANIFNFELLDDEFYQFLLKSELTKARKHLIERNYDYSELYSNLYRVYVPMLDKSIQGEAIIEISQYMYQHSFCVDPEINSVALLLKLISLNQ